MQKIKSYIRLLRFHHYAKNFIIFSPLFFSLNLFHLNLLFKTTLCFVFFSLLTSGVYIFNDLLDIKNDQMHPLKKTRPLASGQISIRSGILLTLILWMIPLFSLLFVQWQVFALALAYVLLNIAYTIKLKHLPIIDVVCIGIGFVIRVYIGGVIGNIPLSNWIIIMTFLLALFLGFAKRRDDLLLYLKSGAKTRKVIDGYNLKSLDSSIIIVATITIVSYIMYTISSEVITKMNNDKLYFSAIFVIMGILHYLDISFSKNQSGSPTKVLYSDRFLQFCILGWILTIGIMIYQKSLTNILSLLFSG
ncbi:MAG: UbiA prenyltransferase family protein [Spirochaetes bacterium]|nr:UbiA prenyltransferase family protein [Spirochaetota bacterium]